MLRVDTEVLDKQAPGYIATSTSYPEDPKPRYFRILKYIQVIYGGLLTVVMLYSHKRIEFHTGDVKSQLLRF